MINKRLLIKNLLSQNNENSFYDKKQKLSLETKDGKAKFLKHICALSNSNPVNNSYIVIGVEDKENKILGVDFFDDSKIQNLVNAYLKNPPKIQYENVHFARLPRDKVVGLVTIYANNKITSLTKNAWKYDQGTIFYRRGSNSIPVVTDFELRNTNKEIVAAIQNNARNNIELTLDGVFDFINSHKQKYNPQYKVFNEQFVLCWAGEKKLLNKDEILYSRVDIALINEQVKLFFSALDDVKISYNTSSFIVTEYIYLGLDAQEKHYPLEKTVINFKENGKHDIVKEFLFKPLNFNKQIVTEKYTSILTIIEKIECKQLLSNTEKEATLCLPKDCLICYLNGFVDIVYELKKAKSYIKKLEDKTTYTSYKEVLRIIRKVKYS